MCNHFKNVITLLIVILKLCTSTSSNFTIKNLGVICSLRDNVITSIPPQCTALAVSSENKDQMNEISAMKGTLPLLIIVENIDFSKVRKFINNDMGEVLADFINIEFDFMVFDKTYDTVVVQTGTQSSNDSYSEVVGSFLDKARAHFPGKGFGLVLNHDIKLMEYRLDLTVLNEKSDLFLLESTDYRHCDYHRHQKNMHVLATKEDVLRSFTDLRKTSVPMNKLIYTIELKIESRKWFASEDMDYSYLCGNKLSNDRKYCFNSIQTLFDKARLRISECAAGIYVNSVEDDDFDGSCGCKTRSDGDAHFRGLKTIAGASQEDKNDLSFYDCSEGAFPVIQ